MTLLKKLISKGALCGLFALLFSCSTQQNQKPENEQVQDLLIENLSTSIEALLAIQEEKDLEQIKAHLREARKSFKAAEPILSFVDSENYKFLNQPNIIKVDEDDYQDIKVKQPRGFQVLEEIVYSEEPNLDEIYLNASITEKRLQLIKNNTNLSFLKDHHILWMVRNEIIRIATTGVTGFDSPVLENSLEESRWAIATVRELIQINQLKFQNQELVQKWNDYLETMENSLQGEFNDFDRYTFIKENINPMFDLWKDTAKDWSVEFPFHMALNNEADGLFDQSTFNMTFFSGRHSLDQTEESIVLGRKLFNDPSLSSSGAMSCATCHVESKSFSETKSVAFEGGRNTPSITYAAFQKGFFYDKRAGSLEGQILHVLKNEKEFNEDVNVMVGRILEKEEYKSDLIKLSTGGEPDKDDVLNVIANYVRSQAPFNSKFDKNINGKEETLSKQEITGFNLFMGKAKCATCHFPPTFNGTVPPDFNDTELESIGVPGSRENKNLDKDLGRYNIYHAEDRKHFFKTPSLRNVSETAPYMHNGVYESLEEVMELYNVGGGIGMGYDVPNQTLPPDSLHLSESEILSVIAFLKTLKDEHLY